MPDFLPTPLDHPNQMFLTLRKLRGGKDEQHRLGLYLQWLNHEKEIWWQPDLAAYRNYLLHDYQGRDGQPLAPSSVQAHLASIRGHYQALLRDNTLRQWLYDQCPPDASAADRKALVDERLQRLTNAIDPQQIGVKVVTRQDRPDEDHLRLTPEQAAALMAAPGTRTLQNLRDTALITLLLCTGLREAESCALVVPDLQQRLNGVPALHVRRGKGAKERLIPYGALIWALDVVQIWLTNAGITSGPVFRGLYKDHGVRSQALAPRTINKTLERYPLVIAGQTRIVQPHDLRRTYARQLYEAGVDLLAIRDNLGHSDSRVTLRYIGAMDAAKRQPPALYPVLNANSDEDEM